MFFVGEKGTFNIQPKRRSSSWSFDVQPSSSLCLLIFFLPPHEKVEKEVRGKEMIRGNLARVSMVRPQLCTKNCMCLLARRSSLALLVIMLKNFPYSLITVRLYAATFSQLQEEKSPLCFDGVAGTSIHASKLHVFIH